MKLSNLSPHTKQLLLAAGVVVGFPLVAIRLGYWVASLPVVKGRIIEEQKKEAAFEICVGEKLPGYSVVEVQNNIYTIISPSEDISKDDPELNVGSTHRQYKIYGDGHYGVIENVQLVVSGPFVSPANGHLMETTGGDGRHGVFDVKKLTEKDRMTLDTQWECAGLK